MNVQINQNELAVRMTEGITGVKRPAGISAAAVLAVLPPQIRTSWLQAAAEVTEYLQECFNAEAPTQWVEVVPPGTPTFSPTLTPIVRPTVTPASDPILPLAEAATGTEYAIIRYEEWDPDGGFPIGCAAVRIAGPGMAGRGLPFIVPADNPERELWGRRWCLALNVARHLGTEAGKQWTA